MNKAVRIVPFVTGAMVMILLIAAFISMSGTPASSALSPNLLVSTETGAAPTLDGTVEALWDSAPSLVVPVSLGWAGSVNVTLKSVYSGGNVYWMVQYADPDLSLRREPFKKQGDGSWLHVPAKSAGWDSWTNKDPNGAYEDKFSIIWNIDNSIAGFNESGCQVMCHWGVDPTPGVFGRKYTNAPGEKADMWHFKSVRTGPVTSYTLTNGNVDMVGQTDDQFVDNTTGSGSWGRKNDPSTGGGYVNNGPVSGLPQYTSPEMPAPPYWIPNATKQAFADTFTTGDEIAGIIINAFAGDRGQITTGSSYDNGTDTWTLEIGRPLVTPDQTNPAVPSANDVQFDDLNDEYFFGVAVFDNAQVEHSTSNNNVYRMVFSGNNPDDKVYYMPWFDNNTAWGMNGDWVNIANLGASPVTAEVEIAGVHIATANVPAGENVNVTAPSGTVGGPVEVACSFCQTTGDSLVVTQRTIYKSSFNEVGSLESADLVSTYAFPWYDNNPAWGMLGDWIVVGNTDTTDALVDIFIGDQVTPVTTLSVPAGGVALYITPGPTFDGPVKVEAQGSQLLIVSQRVIYLDSFNEMLGIPVPSIV